MVGGAHRRHDGVSSAASARTGISSIASIFNRHTPGATDLFLVLHCCRWILLCWRLCVHIYEQIGNASHQLLSLFGGAGWVVLALFALLALCAFLSLLAVLCSDALLDLIALLLLLCFFSLLGLFVLLCLLGLLGLLCLVCFLCLLCLLCLVCFLCLLCLLCLLC